MLHLGAFELGRLHEIPMDCSAFQMFMSDFAVFLFNPTFTDTSNFLPPYSPILL